MPTPTHPGAPREDAGLRLLVAATRHFFLVNAPSAKDADHILSPSAAPQMPMPHEAAPLSLATRAHLRLGFRNSLMSPEEFISLWELAKTPGSELDGVGSYLVEVARASFATEEGGPARSIQTRLVSVQRAELSLDPDLWAPGETLSEAQLRQAVASLIERDELSETTPLAAPSRAPTL